VTSFRGTQRLLLRLRFLLGLSGLLHLEFGALPAASPESLSLPPLLMKGLPLRAHTQGLEIIAGHFWVTARREDLTPRQPLLLRTSVGATQWDVWKLPRSDPSLDHPGGLQSDGQRLWIPLAESRRDGRSLIQAYRLIHLVPGRPPVPEVEFAVPDHVGALAVSTHPARLFGANWDTAGVYEWDFTGRLQKTRRGRELHQLGLGFDAKSAGLSVQDWKVVGKQLYAAGLFRASSGTGTNPASQLRRFSNLLEASTTADTTNLPQVDGTELAREGMAIADGWIFFLPEDLGPTNRVFRIPLIDLSQTTLSSSGK